MDGTYVYTVASPVGEIYITTDDSSITGLWLEGQKYFPAFSDALFLSLDLDADGTAVGNEESCMKGGVPDVIKSAVHWLNSYFSQGMDSAMNDTKFVQDGRNPVPTPSLAPKGTPYQEAVWALLQQIPRGETTTYGELDRRLREEGFTSSARAVGGAVGRNPISILIPCHRVLGADGSLTGYAGGLDRKRWLLMIEGVKV